MPIGLNAVELNAFYTLPELAFGKSIQQAYKFYATFLDNPLRDFDPDIGSMPVIRPYHFMNISIPTYNFEVQSVFYGVIPKTYPVLKMDGLTVNVSFEEDENGTIAYFINWMQKCIIDSNGYYKAPNANRIGNLVVEVQDRHGLPIVYYIFKNLFYVDSSDITYDYNSTESIKYQIRFGLEYMETWYVKAGLISGVQTKVLNGIKSFAKNAGI